MKQQYEAWAGKFLKAKTEPMDNSLSEAFMGLMMAELDGASLPPSLDDHLGYQVAKSRSEVVGLKISDKALGLLACLADRPGTVVMYVLALRYAQHKRGIAEMTVSEIANIFPMGFVTGQALNEMWDAQKGYALSLPCDNMLDKIGDLYKEVEDDRSIA